jgi:hypothetical protein
LAHAEAGKLLESRLFRPASPIGAWYLRFAVQQRLATIATAGGACLVNVDDDIETLSGMLAELESTGTLAGARPFISRHGRTCRARVWRRSSMLPVPQPAYIALYGASAGDWTEALIGSSGRVAEIQEARPVGLVAAGQARERRLLQSLLSSESSHTLVLRLIEDRAAVIETDGTISLARWRSDGTALERHRICTAHEAVGAIQALPKALGDGLREWNDEEVARRVVWDEVSDGFDPGGYLICHFAEP